MEGFPSIEEAFKSFFGCLKGFVAEIDGGAVVRLQDEETNGHGRVGTVEFRVVTTEELGQRDEVAKRFAHLLSVNRYHVVVHPVSDHLVALAGYGLGYLTLVVRKNQVHAASVNIEVAAEVFAPHCGALAVPSRIRRSRGKASA